MGVRDRNAQHPVLADQHDHPRALVVHLPVRRLRGGADAAVATGGSRRKWGLVEWFYLTYALGAIFVVGQIFEYGRSSASTSAHSDSYGSVFYFATGFHGLHVTGGLIAFLLVIGRVFAVKNFTHKEATTAIVVSYYWHFVDVVWIGLFLVIYVLK